MACGACVCVCVCVAGSGAGSMVTDAQSKRTCGTRFSEVFTACKVHLPGGAEVESVEQVNYHFCNRHRDDGVTTDQVNFGFYFLARLQFLCKLCGSNGVSATRTKGKDVKTDNREQHNTPPAYHQSEYAVATRASVVYLVRADFAVGGS